MKKKGNKNMMSQISANVNANVNPVYADVVKVKLSEFLKEPDDLRMFEGWRNWSLRDIVKILKDMARPEKCHGVTAFVMGNIVLRKLLEAATDANIPFEVIEETVHTALEAPIYLKKYDVLNSFSVFNRRAVCDFFKEFVKRGINDARYYDLIYMMLTHRLNGSFPLGFAMSKYNGFNEEVLAKLSSEMQKQLESSTFHKDDEDMDRRLCYSLLKQKKINLIF